MFVFVTIFALVCLYKVKLCPEVFGGGYNKDYLSIEKTTSIKGIFILIVFFSHIKGYITIDNFIDEYAFLPINLIGQGMVTLFLFYSGYGVMESIKKKGISYINSMPKNRLLGTLYRFDIALILFLIIGLLMGNTFSLKKIVLSLIGWDSLGNSNWYIFVIMLLYVFTYVSFMVFRNNMKLGVLGVVVFTLLYIAIVIYFDIKETWWYDTSICYSLGMIYSLYKSKIESALLNKKYYFVILIGLILANGALEYCVLKNLSLAFNLILMPVFTLLVVVITVKVSFNNKMINWCGSHLFEIYVLQRIPMMIFEHFGINRNIYLFFALSLLVTLLFAWVYKMFIDKTWKLIIKR